MLAIVSLALLALAGAEQRGLQLHLGCGTSNPRGCAGVDFGPAWVRVDSGAAFPHALPFPDGSASLIYACHLFSYFDRAQAGAVLAEWRRVLAPGGTLRLAVPDFEAVARLYVSGIAAQEAAADDEPGSGGGESIPAVELDTFSSMLFGKWPPPGEAIYDEAMYHRTVYDARSLARVLDAAGFIGVRRWRWQEVEHGRFDDYSQAYWPHMAKDTGTLVSLNLEATKPLSATAARGATAAEPLPGGAPAAAAWSLAGPGVEAHGPRHIVRRYDLGAFPFPALVAGALGLCDASTGCYDLTGDTSPGGAGGLGALSASGPRAAAGVPTTGRDEDDWDLRRFYEHLRGPPPSEGLSSLGHGIGGGLGGGGNPSALSPSFAESQPFRAAYYRFIAHVHEALFPGDEQLLFQATPSLRIQRWNRTVVPLHADGDATGRHPVGTRNFLLPLTAMRGSASLFLESAPGAGDFKALSLSPGDLLDFDGHGCRHGNEPNLEQGLEQSLEQGLEQGLHPRDVPSEASGGPWQPRVSLDFRVLPGAAYRTYLEGLGSAPPPPSEPKGPGVSRHAPIALVAGKYYRVMTRRGPGAAAAGTGAGTGAAATDTAEDAGGSCSKGEGPSSSPVSWLLPLELSSSSSSPLDPFPGTPSFLMQMHPSFDRREVRAVGAYLEGGGFVTEFTETEALEKELCRGVLGATHCHDLVMTTSGTSALFLALQALGVGPGDEVGAARGAVAFIP